MPPKEKLPKASKVAQQQLADQQAQAEMARLQREQQEPFTPQEDDEDDAPEEPSQSSQPTSTPAPSEVVTPPVIPPPPALPQFAAAASTHITLTLADLQQFLAAARPQTGTTEGLTGAVNPLALELAYLTIGANGQVIPRSQGGTLKHYSDRLKFVRYWCIYTHILHHLFGSTHPSLHVSLNSHLLALLEWEVGHEWSAVMTYHFTFHQSLIDAGLDTLLTSSAWDAGNAKLSNKLLGQSSVKQGTLYSTSPRNHRPPSWFLLALREAPLRAPHSSPMTHTPLSRTLATPVVLLYILVSQHNL
ncbi:hypothetical protein BJ508DRAFT_316003 [Ascobolus immersus RN42]|uniref:Uncharacterized protein n=1 Tax=Ascobolus immersus RN42 TaxID=1160509 RepID=A0A3N4HCG2_ASCIM|nr:hypothetical protein BJ508DRAFT_316003 [Ascobolus immersus RN42]